MPDLMMLPPDTVALGPKAPAAPAGPMTPLRVLFPLPAKLKPAAAFRKLKVPEVFKVPVNMIQLLNLSSLLSTVRRLDELPLILVAGIFVLVVLIAGLLAAGTTSWWALAYNAVAMLSGGLVVELESESGRVLVVPPRRKT